jgi:DNA-binding XRE family transcriptional regulator
MKELRPRRGNLRILFAFDPRRMAILLLGGDKTSRWQAWYQDIIPLADRLYDEHLETFAEGRTAAMTKTRPFADLAEKVKADPVRRERIAIGKRALEDALALAKLRAQQDKTQQEMAEILGVTQANISRIEHEEDLYLSTLRSYVAALGGELEVNAVFADGKVALVPAKG